MSKISIGKISKKQYYDKRVKVINQDFRKQLFIFGKKEEQLKKKYDDDLKDIKEQENKIKEEEKKEKEDLERKLKEKK